MAKTAAVILAAGKGTRMNSDRPKVLHQVAGKCLVQHVIDETRQAGIEQIILVIGHGGDEVKNALGESVTYAWQKEQLGTGHAVMQAVDLLDPGVEQVLVLSGDVPLIRGRTIRHLLEEFTKTKAKVAILTAHYDDPRGYGRIVRDQEGRVKRIVEQGDAGTGELGIKEINSGTYCFCKKELERNVRNLKPDNAQGEYYLTDVIQSASSQGLLVIGYQAEDPRETLGINNRVQLARAEALFRERINEELMLAGVTIVDPHTTYIEKGVGVGQDTIIYPFTMLSGKTCIGKDGQIGPNVTITDSMIGDEAEIRQAVLMEARVGNNCKIGPFSYLRPGTILKDEVKIGDFVEIKNSLIETGSKIPHLTYIGDALVGKSVNVGAGTITCNYDGQHKYQTVIEEGAFIGSNSNLVAPIKIGSKAYVAAGSTLTADVPEGSLAVARERQRVIPNWENQKKEKKQNIL